MLMVDRGVIAHVLEQRESSGGRAGILQAKMLRCGFNPHLSGDPR
jgi:hypothetical protein